MKSLAVCFVASLLLLTSCQSFPGSFGQSRTLGYGAIFLDSVDSGGNTWTLDGIDATPAGAVLALAIPLEMVGPGEFVVNNWTPGKYRVDTIYFQVGSGLFETETKVVLPAANSLMFELKEGQITSIGTYQFHFTPNNDILVGPNDRQLDDKVLADMVRLAANSDWRQPLLDFENSRKSQPGTSSGSGSASH